MIGGMIGSMIGGKFDTASLQAGTREPGRQSLWQA